MDNKGFEYDLGGDTNGYRVTEKYDQEPLTCLVITGQQWHTHGRRKKTREKSYLQECPPHLLLLPLAVCRLRVHGEATVLNQYRELRYSFVANILLTGFARILVLNIP